MLQYSLLQTEKLISILIILQLCLPYFVWPLSLFFTDIRALYCDYVKNHIFFSISINYGTTLTDFPGQETCFVVLLQCFQVHKHSTSLCIAEALHWQRLIDSQKGGKSLIQFSFFFRGWKRELKQMLMYYVRA